MTFIVPPPRARRVDDAEAAAALLLEELSIRLMEEGSSAGGHPPPTSCSDHALRYFIRGFTTIVSLVMVAWLIYARYTTDDSELHDPAKLSFLIVLSLSLAAFGFCSTSETELQRLLD
ncbi:unknown protein [Oryza sativa Japonica Group]|jgi:hypothetical protein|uniref:Os01g0898600 protein n=3 Tax=Oryza TaxID=4527 RepID=A0A8J8Y3X5_ORYSJ|nr:uncharacterized protein LOC4325112 [Oryza sativa Japonica Group]KAB8084751.1 hypothetical protein EE612_007377 [Oryza sativa]EEE55816.1 hypothetical protein OsJ_04418 [Oryza sativa Japonica Group]KAF2953818.1 hypothetical protein DAI22_01g435100 [Oryza sativa Japonica Group]BAB86083.1 unknown protein [Oryza sativa Japonica Group]BAC06906.1 unknown protein [Oryza sativa Japonica Group]|eukprot:NP_001045095.1 Os01g0898600 [Oryza sativa Japonica Group]